MQNENKRKYKMSFDVGQTRFKFDKDWTVSENITPYLQGLLLKTEDPTLDESEDESERERSITVLNK